MSKFELIDFPYFSDSRGETVPFELGDFPFSVQRIYIITGTSDAVRGGHAHREEQELFVAISGSVTAVVNDGSGDQEIVLDTKNKGLLVRNMCWHEFRDFSSDAVVLCFSSTKYEGRGGYIEEKEAFITLST